MLLQHLFDASAAAGPDRTALVFEDRRVSYAELDRRAARWAAWLQRQGVQRGDRVACHMDNGIAFVLALLASLRCGAVFVPLGAACRAARLQAVLADSGACVLFGQPTLRPVTEAALAGAPLVRARLWAEPGADPTEADAADLPSADLPFAEPPTIDLDLA